MKTSPRPFPPAELAEILRLHRARDAAARREAVVPYLQHMARMDPVIFVHSLQAVAEHSARPWLRSLQMPVLVVAGERDNFTPARVAERMLHLLPNGEFCLVPAGSHAAPIELPDLIELKLDAFARRHQLW